MPRLTKPWQPLVTVLLLLLLAGTALSCSGGGDLFANPDDRPHIISVRIREDGAERPVEAINDAVDIVASITPNAGPGGTVNYKQLVFAVYVAVPNTQGEYSLDAVFNCFGGPIFTLGSISRPTVLFNEPGSARGTLRYFVSLASPTSGSYICGGPTEVSSALLSLTIVDIDFKGDAYTAPLELRDNSNPVASINDKLCP